MSNPLSIIINPPGIQYGMPGDIVSLYAVVINEGDISAVIDLFFTFDEAFQKVSGWSNSPRASLAVAPSESSDEVTFNFEIPVDALAGTYDYTFVVDSPNHYPQDTPINFPGQLKVLIKEQTVIRASDPTFSIIPATNPNKPITYRLDQPLQVVIKVENRSNRVDRFRLSCPDFDDNWYKISYPGSGLEGVGLFNVSALELNPNTEGEINLELRPPIDTLAGSYSPTIRLLSENNPDLILLDLIYINIPENYQVGVELNTILDRVSRKLGMYQLLLNNRGNLIRELLFNAKSCDEYELCTYQFEPKKVKLLPNSTEKINLAVKPKHWWRRPFFGQPLAINFQVDITDMQSYPLANASSQATLLWKARPWWQILLLILLGLGLFAGASYIVWKILHPDPLRIESFSTDSPTLIEGNEITLSWVINNYKQIQKLAVITKEPPDNDIGLNFDKTSINQLFQPNKNNPNPPCSVIQEDLKCQRVSTEITSTGKYVFELQASYLQGSSLFRSTSKIDTKTTNVEIQPKPRAEIVEIKPEKQKYQKGEKQSLIWKMIRPELASEVTIDKIGADNVKLGSRKFPFKDGLINVPKYKNACKSNQENNQILECRIDDFIGDKVGVFSYQITVITNGLEDRPFTKVTKAEDKIEVLPKPFQIVFFRINNIDQPGIIQLNEGEKVTFAWKVEGENVQVKLDPFGDVQQNDTFKLTVVNKLSGRVALQVTDKFGKQQSQERAFIIDVKPKPTPTPTSMSINTANPNVSIPTQTRNPVIKKP